MMDAAQWEKLTEGMLPREKEQLELEIQKGRGNVGMVAIQAVKLAMYVNALETQGFSRAEAIDLAKSTFALLR
jgi:hypothetical protein